MCAWAEHDYSIIHIRCTEMSEASYGTAKEFISDLNEGLMAGGTMVLNDGECTIDLDLREGWAFANLTKVCTAGGTIGEIVR